MRWTPHKRIVFERPQSKGDVCDVICVLGQVALARCIDGYEEACSSSTLFAPVLMLASYRTSVAQVSPYLCTGCH